VATRGEHGQPVPGVLAPGEVLADRRVQETRAAAEVLGAEQVVFLGYRDSGMMGEASNDEPGSFWQADLDEAAGRLAEVLASERADLLTVYDAHGVYGHPDHIQVHRVGRRAAELAGLPPERVFAASANRDRIAQLQQEARAARAAGSDAATAELAARASFDVDRFGLPEAELTHAVDVRPVLERKRAAMAVHRSQIAPDSFFLAMPPDVFEASFGTEWFAWLGAARGPADPVRADLLAELDAFAGGRR
jgi:LmbE family N-acetylglucosaminyl deacetylase